LRSTRSAAAKPELDIEELNTIENARLKPKPGQESTAAGHSPISAPVTCPRAGGPGVIRPTRVILAHTGFAELRRHPYPQCRVPFAFRQTQYREIVPKRRSLPEKILVEPRAHHYGYTRSTCEKPLHYAEMTTIN